jgi:hypothetical protein
MRVASLLVLSACVSGCASSQQPLAHEQHSIDAYEPCSINKSKGWVQTEVTNALSDELLSLTFSGKTVREWLGSQSSRRDVWFLGAFDQLLLCSYRPDGGFCGPIETVTFKRSGDEWQAADVLWEVCVSGGGHR